MEEEKKKGKPKPYQTTISVVYLDFAIIYSILHWEFVANLVLQ